MSTVVPPDEVVVRKGLPGKIPARVARDHRHNRLRLRRPRIKARTYESVGLFVLLYGVYLALGYRVVYQQHLVVFDATARLAHGYFVWWNNPPKLAAIGFIWAPLSTLVFLPFTLVKPLATSLMALPATSGFWMALMFVTFLSLMRFLGLSALQRWVIILLVALNPMMLFYAINGMSEAPFMALTAIGVSYFVRWHMTREPHHLSICAMGLTMAALCRYELLVFALIVAVAIPVTLFVRRRSQDEIEGSILAYVGPLFYGIGLWCFFNFLILGDPIYWFRKQFLGGTTDSITPGASGMIGDSGQTGSDGTASVNRALTPFDIIEKVVDVNLRLFPLVLVLMPFLLLYWWRRRDSLAFWLIALLGANAATSALLIFRSDTVALLQLRYNMRDIPVAIIAGAWLISRARPGQVRNGAFAAFAAMLAISIPLTWQTMETYPFQYLERTFIAALETGEDQENSGTRGQYTVGNRDDKEMATYIRRYVPEKRASILTDDGQTFGVMLETGRPQIFRDRIDQGDSKWIIPLEKPWNRVRYILVGRYPRSPFAIQDEVEVRYPGLGGLVGLTAIHANDHYVLLRVARRKPLNPQTRFDSVLNKVRGESPPRL
ncbi:hypothetical protein DSM112329_00101 [Paraconexibacter sp. AEG42_29]|uniref:Glycosyltransferase RgtA/B/C/D-like domain-containing protein n=1 Tax=Paraconexibacter sp. AEG42_29 TaxID=2997339 RepID=A0AAU7APJ7_9ACTN